MEVLYEGYLSWLAQESVEGEGGAHTKEKDMRCERYNDGGTTQLCLYILLWLLSLPLVSLLSMSVIVSEQVNKRTSTLQSCALAIGISSLGASLSRLVAPSPFKMRRV